MDNDIEETKTEKYQYAESDLKIGSLFMVGGKTYGIADKNCDRIFFYELYPLFSFIFNPERTEDSELDMDQYDKIYAIPKEILLDIMNNDDVRSLEVEMWSSG